MISRNPIGLLACGREFLSSLSYPNKGFKVYHIICITLVLLQRICSGCKIYFTSKAAVTRHHRGGGCVALEEEDDSVDERYAEMEVEEIENEKEKC